MSIQHTGQGTGPEKQPSSLRQTMKHKGKRLFSRKEMVRRQYLIEDIAQIKRYFPGARTVALRTPFDITPKPAAQHIDIGMLQAAQEPARSWQGKLRWMN